MQYVTGDATLPLRKEPTVIMHVCNNQGVMGAGFVLPLARRYPRNRDAYIQWRSDPASPGTRMRTCASGQISVYESGPQALGHVQISLVGPDLYVANLIGQTLHSTPPICYPALGSALRGLRAWLQRQPTAYALQCPRMGAGLAGGDWQTVAAMIERELEQHRYSVTVIDLPQ